MTLLEYIKKVVSDKDIELLQEGCPTLVFSWRSSKDHDLLKVKNLIAPVEEEGHKDEPENFTGFLEVIYQNKAEAVIITIVLLSSYTICFLSMFFMWKQSNDLEKTVLEEEEEDEKKKNAAKQKRDQYLWQQGRYRLKSVYTLCCFLFIYKVAVC